MSRRAWSWQPFWRFLSMIPWLIIQRLRRRRRSFKPRLIVTNPHRDVSRTRAAVRHLRLVHSNRDEMRRAL